MTKQQKDEVEWRAHNKRYRHDKRLQLTYDQYIDWKYGKRKSVKKSEKDLEFGKPVWATTTEHIKSLQTNKTSIHSNRSMMSKVKNGEIIGADAELVIAKSKRIALLTSKGCYGYVGDDVDPKTLGKKTQQLESL